MSAVHGLQGWDFLRFAADLGEANTGKTVTLTIQRLIDSRYWTGSAWQVAPATVSMPQVDATNFPGLYEYEMPASGLGETAARRGYRFRVDEGTVPFHEVGVVYPWTPRLLDEDVADHQVADSIGEAIFRSLGTRHGNTKIVHTAWNSAGRPTAGYLLLYNSAADLIADASPWPLAVGRYDFTLAYDGSGRLTEYVSERTS